MPGYGARFWAERTPASRRRPHPVLRGEQAADVVVIGGGLTGAMMAAVLAGGGLDVILLESDRLASGATAGSLGAILPQPDATFRSAEDLAGLRAARLAWKEARSSGRELARRLGRLTPKSDVVPASVLVNAATAAEAGVLRREQAVRQAAGLDAPWVAPRAAATALGTESAGAVRLADAFLFDPVRATLALAADAERRGARVFERSPVYKTKFTRKSATVITEHGIITAARGVVVATGGPGRLFSQLRRHVREQQGFVVVTEPLTAAMRREAGQRKAVLTEPGEAPHLLRWLPDHRALFAGALTASAPARQLEQMLVQRTGQLMYELSLRYPVISGLPARWSWARPVVSTPDGLPWIGSHRNYPFHFFALAFGWHGDALGWWAARAALRFFTDSARREDEWLGFIRHL